MEVQVKMCGGNPRMCLETALLKNVAECTAATLLMREKTQFSEKQQCQSFKVKNKHPSDAICFMALSNQFLFPNVSLSFVGNFERLKDHQLFEK